MGIFDWLSSLSKQFLYLSIAANIPSLILYIIEIITILRHKQFHNPFYKLVLIRAIPVNIYKLLFSVLYRVRVKKNSVIRQEELTILLGALLTPRLNALLTELLLSRVELNPPPKHFPFTKLVVSSVDFSEHYLLV